VLGQMLSWKGKLGVTQLTRRKKLSIADRLSEALGGEWKAVRDVGDFSWHWVQEGTDRTVRGYAEPVLGYDGWSDEEFNMVYLDNKGVRVGCASFGSKTPFFFKDQTCLKTLN
jgi:hypothetical protein